MISDSPFAKPRNLDEAITLLACGGLLLFPFLLFIGSAGPEIIMSVTGALFLVHSAITRNWAWLREKWLLCLAVLWAYMMLRGLFAEQPKEALRRSLPFLRYWVFSAALAFWVMKQPHMPRYFINVLLAAMGFALFDGLFQFLFYYDIFGRTLLLDGLGHVRLTGPFGQTKPILGIMLAWFSFPLCLYLLRTPQGNFRKGQPLLIGVVYAAITLCMIALSGERMALLLTLFGCALAVLLMRVSKKLVLGCIVGGVLMLTLLAVAVPSFFDRQIESTIQVFSHWNESAYGILMASNLRIAELNPVFGVGTNHFRIVCPQMYAGIDEAMMKAVCNIHPHNIFIEWLIESGVIGLSLFVAFIVLLFAECRKAWPAMRLNPIFIGWIIAVCLRIWPIGSTTGFFSNWGAPPFWLAVGMLLAYCKMNQAQGTGHDHPHLSR